MTSYQLSPDEGSHLYNRISRRLKDHPGQSAFYPLVQGDEALMARTVSLRMAEHSIDIQTYIWRDDLTGKFLMNEVYSAAERGVRVRLLLDDLNQGHFQKQLLWLDQHPNIEVRLVNPFENRYFQALDIVRFKKMNRRMHNKSFIVDNLLAIVGGRNFGDEYFDASGIINFGDLDLWTAGPIVGKISEQFDIYWNSEIAHPIESVFNHKISVTDAEKYYWTLKRAKEEALHSSYGKALVSEILEDDFSKVPRRVYWGKSSVLYDPPTKLLNLNNKPANYLSKQLRPNVGELKNELILISPYFVPGERGMKLLKDLRERGVRIVVLTNSLASNDVPTVFSGYKKYRKDLLKLGIELYELQPKPHKIKRKRRFSSSAAVSGLHTKTFVFDRREIFVGSMNLDPRSFDLNTEMGIVAQGEVFSADVAKSILERLPEVAYRLSTKRGELIWTFQDSGKEQVFTKEPETNWWQRFKAGFYSFLVPESLL